MHRFLFALLIALLPAASVLAQDWAKARLEKSPRHGEWVKIKQGQREVQSFQVFPEVKGKATAVVVIHEIFGLTDWVRSLADELAEAGYIAIAPDLVPALKDVKDGKNFDFDKARKALSEVPAGQITADLNAVVKHLAELPSCNGKVVVCGFCWGGGETFRCATNNKDIKAAYVFYGPPPEEKDVEKIACPVYGFYGENDNRINATIPKAKEMMEKAGKMYDPVVYEGAGHAFMRVGEDPNGKEPNHEANKKARDEAWKRWKELLKRV
ncbi:MAG TPA: dienelactone hydrolase family protein [Gemmataceae bacterium]|nr:dienelactone hydrolase family protein [Gemmataceae bacterium]